MSVKEKVKEMLDKTDIDEKIVSETEKVVEASKGASTKAKIGLIAFGAIAASLIWFLVGIL